jgi:hypothetical protein
MLIYVMSISNVTPWNQFETIPGIQNHILYEKPHYDYVTHPLITQKANACISSQIPNTQLYTTEICQLTNEPMIPTNN